MDNDVDILGFSAHLALLSLMAVGGGLVMIAPEISEYVVTDRAWLLKEQFTAAYVLAQAAPGPNLLFISLIGWFISGWYGAVAATAAVLLPSILITLALIRARVQHSASKFSVALSRAIAPISIGLLVATAWVFATATDAGWHGYLVTGITALLLVKTRLNPVLLIGLGALVGASGLI
ncbi:chromate transporter [Noviherbaspirillum aerium]|uniref:chromate transporter n=1 Tax=Noviherbaspirillum aerium TaxID=2588497 RepID=UPI00124D92B2|nr:chromate transporter [Noviherbaspirillum aerium]